MQQEERDLPAEPQEHAKERLDQPPDRKRFKNVGRTAEKEGTEQVGATSVWV